MLVMPAPAMAPMAVTARFRKCLTTRPVVLRVLSYSQVAAQYQMVVTAAQLQLAALVAQLLTLRPQLICPWGLPGGYLIGWSVLLASTADRLQRVLI